jgi:hypothetical protein
MAREISDGERLEMFLAFQQRVVEEHQYFHGLFCNRKVDMNETYMDWYTQHHAENFRAGYDHHADAIMEKCGELCAKGCEGVGKCVMSIEDAHLLLDDWYAKMKEGKKE